jgi:rubrerythrin
VDACPSHAISLIPEEYPPQQETTNEVKAGLKKLSESKSKQEMIASEIAQSADDPILSQLASALSMSNRLMTEDVLRESEYMLPQSKNVIDFLKSLLESSQPDGFPKESVEKLIKLLNLNNKENIKMDDNKTLKNLMEAFAGEAQANRKYLAYSKKAEKEGHVNAAKLFKAASDAETIHALRHFEVAGKVGSTADNLKDGVAGETHEYKEMYPPFVKEAEAEGNKAAVRTFTYAMKAEEVHAGLYKEALDNLNQSEEIFYYLCPVCGNIEKARPGKCPICGVAGDKFIKY